MSHSIIKVHNIIQSQVFTSLRVMHNFDKEVLLVGYFLLTFIFVSKTEEIIDIEK
jgi:hypothetical protein